jgi:hypothetical protein
LRNRLVHRVQRLEKERLEKHGRLSPPSHGWGVSREELNRQWQELPAEIARKALEIRGRRERGNPEDPLPLSRRSGGDLAALCVSYGRPEDVPSEICEAVAERDSRAFTGLPEEAGRTMKDLWQAVVAEAFECARRASQAKEERGEVRRCQGHDRSSL